LDSRGGGVSWLSGRFRGNAGWARVPLAGTNQPRMASVATAP